MQHRGRRRSDSDSGAAGFVALDALVAMTLVSLLLAMTLNVSAVSLKSARTALERSRATAEAEYRLASEAPRLHAGQVARGMSADGSFRWTVSKQLQSPGAGTPGVCAISSDVQTSGSRRAYRLQTVRFCLA